MATGSILLKKDIITKAFQASNCGYEIDWKPEFIQNMKEHLKKHYYFNNVIQKGEDYYQIWTRGKFYLRTKSTN
jgi:hypothetical protein